MMLALVLVVTISSTFPAAVIRSLDGRAGSSIRSAFGVRAPRGSHHCLELTRHDGPITFARGSQRAALSSLRVARTDFGVGLTDDHGFEIDLVEHFLAAIGGLGIGGGVLATLDGPELPILDGGARAFVDALIALEIPPMPRRWIVQKPGKVTWKESVYDFDVMESVEIVVLTEFEHPGIGQQRASWDGDARRFADEIAPARTFGFVDDADDLCNSSRARLAALASTGDDAAMKALATQCCSSTRTAWLAAILDAPRPTSRQSTSCST